MIRKNIVFILAVLVFFSAAYPASAEDVVIDREVLEKILQRQDALEQELERLKESLKKKDEEISAPVAPTEDIQVLKEDVEEMSERLDVVETKSILDKIQLGGELRTQMEFIDFDNIRLDGQERDGNTEELWSNRFRINLRSEITDDIIFQGRLSYYRYWGGTNYERSESSSRYFMNPDQEGDLYVERAYIDYFVPGTPFAITFGRLPTSNAPPYEFKNYTTRKATWSQLFVDGEFDGIIGNLSLEKWTGLKNAMFRVCYSKVGQNYKQYKGINLDPLRVAVANFDTEIPGMKNSLLWLGYYRLFDMIPFRIEGIPYPEDSGDMDVYAIHLQFDNIKNSGLGWFGSFGYNNIHPRSEGTELGPGYEVGMAGDSLHGDLGKKRNGYSVYTGLRYILPIESLKYPQIGFEYNYGSQYWFPVSTHDVGEFTNKLGINGSAYELYYVQPVAEKRMFCRIGAVYQDFDYIAPMYIYGSREGEDAKSNMTILQTYFLVDVRF